MKGIFTLRRIVHSHHQGWTYNRAICDMEIHYLYDFSKTSDLKDWHSSSDLQIFGTSNQNFLMTQHLDSNDGWITLSLSFNHRHLSCDIRKIPVHQRVKAFIFAGRSVWEMRRILLVISGGRRLVQRLSRKSISSCWIKGVNWRKGD